jgi:hypothetical protein
MACFVAKKPRQCVAPFSVFFSFRASGLAFCPPALQSALIWQLVCSRQDQFSEFQKWECVQGMGRRWFLIIIERNFNPRPPIRNTPKRCFIPVFFTPFFALHPCLTTSCYAIPHFRVNGLWLVSLHLSNTFMCYAYWREEETPIWGTKTDTKINNVSSNFKGCVLVINWMCENECDNPWQNICDSDDMQNLPSMTSLISTN